MRTLISHAGRKSPRSDDDLFPMFRTGFIVLAISLLFDPVRLYGRRLPELTSLHRPLCFYDDKLCLPFYLSIFCVIKNEAPYIAEWIEYHLLVGVQRFWIVNNDSEDDPETVLKPYIAAQIVNFTNWPGRTAQLKIYRHLIPTLKNTSFWVAVIDLDEFIIPVVGRSVPNILRRLEAFPGITLNWLVYGSNGELAKAPGLVMERFTKHTAWEWVNNRFTKVIVNPRRVAKIDIHDNLYVGGNYSRNVFGMANTKHMFCRPPVHDVLRLNHYRTKSKEEFRTKLLRGDAVYVRALNNSQLIERIPKILAQIPDVIRNDHTIDWAIPLVKRRLAWKKHSVSIPNFGIQAWPFVIPHHIIS